VIETKAVPESNDHLTPTTPIDDTSIGDVVDSVKLYAKQEIAGPLSGAGRWMGYGVAAAATLGVGLTIVLLGLLRLLQTEWDRSASGSLSWVAYLITLLITLLLLYLTISRIKKSTLTREPK